MTRKDFEKTVTEAVNEYINNFYRFDSNPQLCVIPSTLEVRLMNGADIAAAIEDNDEAVENAAIAHGMANQESMDDQVKRNPDFYSLKSLLKAEGNTSVANPPEIRKLANNYTFRN